VNTANRQHGNPVDLSKRNSVWERQAHYFVFHGVVAQNYVIGCSNVAEK
jgi:hypothetical protein